MQLQAFAKEGKSVKQKTKNSKLEMIRIFTDFLDMEFYLNITHNMEHVTQAVICYV